MTLSDIKDLIVIIFLVFASGVVVLATVLGIRLYWRVGRFMDRMEKVGDRMETTFHGITVAGRALRPVARALRGLAMAQEVGRIFGFGRKREIK